MTFKSKTLAALTAFAVSGIALSSNAFALTPIQKIQAALQKVAGPNVVIVSPHDGQTYATDQQFADAVLASIKTTQPAKKNSPKAALSAAFALAVESNANYSAASTLILKTVSGGLAKSTVQLGQAISGAFMGFDFGSVNSKNSAAAALIDSSLLGIETNTTLTTGKLNAAYVAATKAAVKAAIAQIATPGASVGAAAQFANSSTMLSAIIKAAVSKAYTTYNPIAQAVATAIQAIDQGTYTNDVTTTIVNAVAAGYNAGFAASHGGALPSKSKRAQVLASINAAVSTGLSQTTGLGAAGLANYTYNNLGSGPVTDIYGL